MEKEIKYGISPISYANMDTTDKEVYNRVLTMFNETPSPNGWVIGSAIKDSLMRYFETDLMSERDVKDDNDLSLMGLPYIIDNNNPERIEIIS